MALSLVLNDPAVRFARAAPGLLLLPGGTSASAVPRVQGGLVAEPSSEGFLLRSTGIGRGSLRWELPAATGLEKLQVTGALRSLGGAPPAGSGQFARLIIVQPGMGQKRAKRRLVARWPADASPDGFDRWIRVPDPTRPLRVLLIVKPHAGTVLLERLRVSGFAARPWVDSTRWLLFALWIWILGWSAWRLTGPMTVMARWACSTVLALLLAGILAPPSVLRSIRALLTAWLPIGAAGGTGLDTATLGHFGLFALLGAILGHARIDLGWPRLLALLAALAGVTELLQLFIDGRRSDGHDLVVDLLGAAFGLLLVGGLRNLRHPGGVPLS